MRKVEFDTHDLVIVFRRETVLSMDMIKEVLGTTSKTTIHRKLTILGHRASYSHAGKYHTLDEMATYNYYGLWSFGQIHFSKYGSLVNTLESLICRSKEGYFASELHALVHVRVFNCLTQLVAAHRVTRKQIGREFLYISPILGSQQLERRKESIVTAVAPTESSVPGFSDEELRGSLSTFLSILNEKQKRIYLGFESMKLGHGGDVKLSRLTGIDVRTIAKGRQELKSKNITPDRIREPGAGRPSIKKN